MAKVTTPRPDCLLHAFFSTGSDAGTDISLSLILLGVLLSFYHGTLIWLLCTPYFHIVFHSHVHWLIEHIVRKETAHV